MGIFKKLLNNYKKLKANSSWKNKREYLIKQGATIGEGTRFNCSTDAFGSEPYLVTIGKDCLFASGARFLTHDGGIKVLNSLNKFDGKKMDKFAPVVIGDNVYTGVDVTIMPGVKIGNNCIIGAGSIVTHDIPDNSVAVGIPAKVIKTIDEYYQSLVDKKGL